MPKVTKKPRLYTEGDAEVTVSYHPHGRAIRAYGRWGYPFVYVAYFSKQGKRIFTTSFRRDIRIRDIKSILHDIAVVPMPKHFSKTFSFWEKYCAKAK